MAKKEWTATSGISGPNGEFVPFDTMDPAELYELRKKISNTFYGNFGLKLKDTEETA